MCILYKHEYMYMYMHMYMYMYMYILFNEQHMCVIEWKNEF